MAEIYCDYRDYAGLHSRAEYFLRLDNVPKFLPGYELLLKAIVLRHVEGPMTENMFLRLLKENVSVIPFNNTAYKKRDDALQWMIEALYVADIIPEDHEDDVVDELYSYIREIAGKL